MQVSTENRVYCSLGEIFHRFVFLEKLKGFFFFFFAAHCMTSTVKTTMLMVTVTRAATMQSVNGMVWTVLTTCQRSWQMGI